MPHTQYCSFCGTSEHEARKLIVTGNSQKAAICERCVLLCLKSLAQDASLPKVAQEEFTAMAVGLSIALEIPLSVVPT